MSFKQPTSIADRPPFQKPNYVYRATVLNVVDGDTIDVSLDVGFRATITKRLRFLLIDTYETRGEESDKGLLAKARLDDLLKQADRVYVQTIMDAEGKFGRVLAWVWLETAGVLTCANAILLEEGHGTVYGS